MRISRRGFLHGVAGVTAFAGWVAGPGGERVGAGEAFGMIDTHQHLWDLKRVRLPWLQGAGPLLNRSYLPEDYARAMEGLNVAKSIYMEVDVAAECKQAEAEYVLEICRRGDTPMVGAVIGGLPGEEGFRGYITQFKGNRYIKGVRQVLGKAELLEDAQFRRGIQLLGDLGMSFDLCHSPKYLPEAIRLVDACPGTRFILDHCGNADVKAFLPRGGDEAESQERARREECERWRRDMGELARRKNVVCKISGIIASAPAGWRAEQLAPIVDHCLEVFGPERVVFAGDWPVCTRVASLREWVGALKQIVSQRSVIERRKLFHDNAERWYGLEG